MNTLTAMVRNGKKVYFMFYRKGELWYKTECGFEYPVPIADTGDGAFLNEDKAIFHMRYIRPHLAMVEKEKAA